MPSLLLMRPKPELGINWNKTADTITRTLNAKGYTQTDFSRLFPWNRIRRCNLADNGTVTAYHGDAGFKYDGTNGQVMVECPKFYYKVGNDASNYLPRVSQYKKSGYKVHPAFVNDGVEKSKTYIGAFEASCYDVSGSAYNTTDAAGVDITAITGDKLASIAGAKPLSGKNNSITLPNFRTLAHNRGSGWELQTFNQISALQMLYIIEYGNWNAQTQIDAGVTNITDDASTNMAINTGYTAGVGVGALNLGNASGASGNITHYQTSQTTKAVSYRGVENLWGNIWKWVDGINIKADHNPWIADHDYASDTFTHPYTDAGTISGTGGYVSDITVNANMDYGLLPSGVGGSSTTKLCDYYYTADGNRAALLGGLWADGALAGPGSWHLAFAASDVHRGVGARLAFFVAA